MEIIRAASRFTNLIALVALLFLAQLGLCSAGDLLLQKVPPLTVEQAPSYPENLARYTTGARIEVSGSERGDASKMAESALLTGDPTIGYALNSGSTTLLIALPQVENVDTIGFLTRGLKGDVAVATSNAKLPADSPQWHGVAKQDLTDAVRAKVGPGEAKYVRLTFNVTEPGHIAALGVYPTATVSAFTSPRSRKAGSFAMVSYNVTNIHAKARAAYVSSGDDLAQANNMIDDQTSTTYTFAANDGAPTAIIDLGKPTKLRRISALISPHQGTLQFYVADSLPGTQASTKSIKIDDATLAGLQSVGSATDEGTGRVAVDFPETTGRYILLKYNSPQTDVPFSVAEVAAFGAGTSNNLLAANTSAASTDHERMSSDGKSTVDSKDFKDLGEGKDMPEEGPAEGPGAELPPPPPFTFVPEVLPTSP